MDMRAYWPTCIATGKSSAKFGWKKRSAWFLGKLGFPVPASHKPGARKLRKAAMKQTKTNFLRNCIWMWKRFNYFQTELGPKLTAHHTLLPGWAPNSITCSLDISCPATIVFVATWLEWRVDRFLEAEQALSGHSKAKCHMESWFSREGNVRLWYFRRIKLPQWSRKLRRGLPVPDCAAVPRKTAACFPSPTPDAAKTHTRFRNSR
jgi:hypothetical protein